MTTTEELEPAKPGTIAQETFILVLGGDIARDLYAVNVILPKLLSESQYDATVCPSCPTLTSSNKACKFRSQNGLHPSCNRSPYRCIISSGDLDTQNPLYPKHIDPYVHIDDTAVDTLTNFTSTLSYFTNYDELSSSCLSSSTSPSLSVGRNVHVKIVTSAFHVRRSELIAAVIYGWYGISYEFIPVPDDYVANYLHLKSYCSATNYGIKEESWLRILRDVVRSCIWVVTGFEGRGIVRWFHSSR